MPSYSQSDTFLKNSSAAFFKKIYPRYKVPLIFLLGAAMLIFTGLFFLLRSNEDRGVVFQVQQTSDSQIKVDVAGAVEKPGVYTLALGSRIFDLLVKAGGLSASSDRDWVAKNLNQAKILADGAKIYIPSIGEVKDGKMPNDGNNLLGISTGLLNINSASKSELETLPGVGPVTAGKIIAGRPYSSLEELKSKKAIGNSVYEKIKDLLTL